MVRGFLPTFVLALVCFVDPVSAQGDDSPIDRRISFGEARGASSPRGGVTSVIFPTTVVENGVVCTLIDFEGVGNLSPIPEFDGISSPNWLGIIDSDAGGSGNIAFEPSPSTIAFWLGGPDGTGSSRDIVFAEPATVVEFFYASSVTTFLEAFDDRGARVTSVAGGANFNLGRGGDPNGQYNRWDRLRLDAGTNRIVRIRVSGAINQTGIDNLKVCRRAGVDTVEFTQAIQEIQDLDDLKADLRADGEPPVPLVRNKPAVLRVYFHEVQAVTTLRVEATLGGQRETRSVTLQPGCDRAKLRQQAAGCASTDFYFTPSAASFPVDLRVTDLAGTEIERHSFPLRTRATEPLVLGAVKVCDTLTTNNAWLCAENYRQRLGALLPLLRKLAPTSSVEVIDTGETVRSEVDATGSEDWWWRLASEIDDLSSIFDGIRDFFGLEDRRYYGMVRSVIPGTVQGMAGGIPSRGAASRNQVLNDEGLGAATVAHETFHTLGRFHTDIEADGQNPLCFGEARDDQTDWSFPDSLLRSRTSSGIEVGFDVALRRATAPNSTFDIMSYCLASPWISPYTYTQALEQSLTRLATRQARTTANGTFWLVSGMVIRGSVRFDPLYEFSSAGPTDQGTGGHRLEVRNATGSVLLTRRFDLSVPEAFVVGGSGGTEGTPSFSQLIPVQAGAASLAVKDPGGRVIGTLSLSGVAPTVTITFPRGGEVLTGARDLTWQTTDSDSSRHTYWVQYSPDGGALGSWKTLGFVTTPHLRVNFDQLAGTVAGGRSLIRVVASDGARSSTGPSAAFTVPTKAPTVQIDFPPNGAVFQPTEGAWLQAAGFDPEDGTLTDLAWRSSLNGALGNGPSVPVRGLSPGTHRLTLTGRDSEGKTATGEVQVVVAGTPPSLDLRAEALDTLPTTCVEVTFGARAGSVPLRNVEYSLDGGAHWQPVALASLPQRFIVPGRGFFHLVARAFDVSGQLAAEDTRFFTESACQANVPSPPPGAWQSTGELPGFRFKARIGTGAATTTARAEADCLGETLCLSGNLPGRSELFTRVIGPRPNGFLWVNLVRFTTSDIEVWIEQTGSGQINYYRLPATDQGGSELSGLVDKEAFLPDRAGAAPGPRLRTPGMAGVTPTFGAPTEPLDFETGKVVVVTSPEFPGYRFRVKILSGGTEVTARNERDCLDETVCISGAIPGRSEFFLRLIGPRPNGFLWVNLVRFTTSRVEVEVEQIRTRRKKTYVLPELARDGTSLGGLVDREAFRP